MLNVSQLIGFGVGGSIVPPVTYANTWAITNNGSTTTYISDVAVIPGTKTLVFGIMQSDNGGRTRFTTGVSITGGTATLRAQANNDGAEYHTDLSFWEVQTELEVITITINRTSGGVHGAGVARMWVFPSPLGAPAATLRLAAYGSAPTDAFGTLDKHADGRVLALVNGYNGTPYISGIANNGDVVWVNRSAHELPTITTLGASISYGPITGFYNQMMLAVSWMPSS